MKKFLKFSFIYLCITVLTAVGMVFVARPSDNEDSSFEVSSGIEEPTTFDMLMNGVMSSKGFEISFDAEVNSEDSDPLQINGQVYLDLSNGFDTVAVQGLVNVSNIIDLDFAYVNNCFYLTIFNGKYKVKVTNLLDTINFITNLVNGEDLEIENVEQNNNETGAGFDVSQILAVLQNLKDEKFEDGHKLSCNLFNIEINIYTDKDYHIYKVCTSEIKIDKYSISLQAELNYLEEAKLIEVDTEEYFDLATLTSLLEAVVNTSKLSDFHITTNLNINMKIASIKEPIKMEIPIDAKIKIVDDKPEIMAQIGPIPVISPVDDDAPYQFGNTVSGIYCGLNRILKVYYADGYVYFSRSEIVPVFGGKTRTYDKMLKITLEELLEDPLMLLSYGFGFKDIVMNEIYSTMELATNREKPIDISNVLLGFDYDGANCSIVLNLQELANNPKLGALTLGLTVSEVNGKNYITGGSFNVNMPISNSFTIDIETANLTLNNIGQSLDWAEFDEFVTSYPYKVDEKWHAYNSKWELASATTYTVSFEENGGEEVDDISGAIDTRFELPILKTRIVDDYLTKITYTFDGWYTNSDFNESSKCTEGIITRGDKTLYAKWNEKIEYYFDVFITNEMLDSSEKIHAIAGTELILKNEFENVVLTFADKTITYSFVGWFVNNGSEQWTGGSVPNYNLHLFAKWKIINIEETKLLNIYDNGILVSSTAHKANEKLVLPTDVKIVDTTKWYTDASYINEVILPSIMPNKEISVHIRNIYTVTVVDTTCNNETLTFTAYQGESISLPQNYATVVVDDGTKTKQKTFKFKGFDNNLNCIPNKDTTVNVQWDCDVKYYYNVTFSKDTNASGGFNDKIEFYTTDLRVLEGTVVDLTQFSAKWVYQFAIWYHHDFQGWATSKGGESVTSVTVTADTTIYANWGKLKTGKI